MELFDLKSATLEELQTFFAQIGQKPFRAKQVYEWMHKKQAVSIDEMTNLSKELREQLKRECTYTEIGRAHV